MNASHTQPLRVLDAAWTALLERHGFVLNRRTTSWVSYDGAGTVSVAPDAELDQDDCLAQIVFHELCHWWVEGDAARTSADWGLDNTNDAHVANEHAALVLQATLADAHGLRAPLQATTDFRSWYNALPADPFAIDDARVVALARGGLDNHKRSPLRAEVDILLAECARVLIGVTP